MTAMRTKCMGWCWAAGLVLGGLTVGMQAQGDVAPISTERPTLGPSAPTLDLVPAGSLQVEAGGGVLVKPGHVVGDWPETLTRLGVSSRVELRYSASNVLYEASDQVGQDPMVSTDASVGVKVRMGKTNGWAPQAAIVALNLPVGAGAMTSGAHDPAVVLGWAQTTRGKLSLLEAAQSTLTTEDGERHATLIGSVNAALPVTERWSAFADVSPNFIAAPKWSYGIDAGALYAAGPRLLLDVRAGFCRDGDGEVAHFADAGLWWAVSGVQQVDLRLGYSGDGSGTQAAVSVGYSVRYDHLAQRLPWVGAVAGAVGRRLRR